MPENTTTTPDLNHPTISRLKAKFPQAGLRATEFRGQTTVVVSPSNLHDVMQFLRDDEGCQYDFLSDVFGIDYLNYPVVMPGRFAVTYLLSSYAKDDRLTIKVYLDPSMDTTGAHVDPALEVDSVTDIWAGAEWPERETFDMFGIRFRNHPDLRRILTFDDFKAHPLRKDYPLQGNRERENYVVVHRDDA